MNNNTAQLPGEPWLEHPPSLTGGGTDQKRPYFTGIDYLRITVWGGIEGVITRVDDWLNRWCPNYATGYERHDTKGRTTAVHVSALPGLVIEEGDDFQGVRIKGTGCALLGMDALLDLFPHFSGLRWQASRIDLAWDGFPLSTRQIFDLLKGGHVNTRATLDPHPVGDLDSDPIEGKGSTVYTHLNPEQNKVPRYIRFYDMRGPVRCELVLKKKYAAAFVDQLVGVNVEAASQLGLSALRGFIDLTHPDDLAKRPTRRRLHPDWLSFVEDASAWRLSDHRERLEKQGLERIGTYEYAVQRSARRLYEAMQAFGPEWVIARIEHHGQAKASLTDIEALKAIRSAAAAKRVAGVQPYPDETDAEDVPF